MILKKLFKFLCAVVAICVVVVVAFAVQLFNDRKAALEFAVAFVTDYRLSIEGDFSFGTEDGVGSISFGNATLSTAFDNQPLLTIGRLELIADFGVFSMTSANIQKLRADDVVATIIKNEDGRFNWPALFENKPGSKEEERDWDIILGKINFNNVLLDLEGFADRPQQLHIESLSLSENLKPRVIETRGRLNNLPIKAYGELYDLSAFVLDEQPLRLSLHTIVDNFRADLQGVFSNSDATTDIRLNIEADNMDRLAKVFSDDLPNLGQLSVSAQLLNVGGGYQLRDIDAFVDGPDLDLSMKGRVEDLLADPALALTLSLASPDIGRFEILDKLTGIDLSGLQVDIAGHLSYQNQQAIFADLSLSASDQEQSIQVSTKNLRAALQGPQTIVEAVDAILDYQIKDPNKKVTTPWRYRYRAEALYADIKPGANTVIKTNGEYKGLPISANGVWGGDGVYRFDVVLDQAVATINGFLKEDQFQIIGRLVTPSLKPLGILLDEAPLPVTQGEIVIAVDNKGEDWMLSQLDLTLENNSSKITVAGYANDLLNFDDYRLKVGVEADSLDHLEEWVSSNSENVERSLDAFGDTRTYASSGDVKYRRAQADASSWLQELMALLALDEWLEEYPALNGDTDIVISLAGQADHLTIDIDSLTLRSVLAEVDWVGEIVDKDGQSSLQGNLKASLQPGALQDIVTTASLTMATVQNNQGPLKLSSMQVVAGNSEFTGNLELTLDDGLKKVAGQLDFKTLDIKPYTSEFERVDKEEEKTSTSDGFFSKEKYSLAWLPTYNIDLEVSAGQLTTPWFDASQLQLEVLFDDDRLSIKPASFMLADATVEGGFSFDMGQAEPAVELKFLARNLDLDLISLMRDYDVMKSGTVDMLVDITATGATEKALAASLNGQTTVYTIDSLLNGRDLSDLSPEVLSEVNQRVNPFYKKPKQGENTILECGVIHFEIEQGVMTADKSVILVTPAIVFGANGAIDLSQETLRMQIIPRVRKGLGLSFRGSAAKMAVINGPMTAPAVEFDPKGAITSAGRDVAGTVLYGPIYWLYLGQAQKLLASSSACPKLIEKLQEDYRASNKG